MKDALISVFIHTFVVGVMIAVAWLFVHLFGIENQYVAGAIGLVLIALEKTLRALPSVPVSDYVNDR